jgi:hypothetical protein
MRYLNKVLVFGALFILGLLIAGMYGVVHDQITYTISTEYFTKFKFLQFGLDGYSVVPRIKVAIVGFLASWWMGIPIGLVVSSVGFIHYSPRRMFVASMKAFGIVALTTLAVGLAGLAYGFFRTSNINLADYSGWYIPDSLEHLRSFLCVGYMHNSSYLGGVMGIVSGIVAQFSFKVPVPPNQGSALLDASGFRPGRSG